MLQPMFWIKLRRAGRLTRRGYQLVMVVICAAILWCPGELSAHASGLELGLEAIHQQDYPTAIQYFDEVIQQDRASGAAYEKRCLAHLLMNRPSNSIDDCSTALKLNPEHTQALFYRGLAWYRLNQYEAAIADFTHHLAQYPEDARTYYNRGLATEAQGDVEWAIANYQQALRRVDTLTTIERANLYNDLGIAYLNNAQPVQALRALDQAIELDESDPRAYFNRGCVCHHKGDYAAALVNFDQALILNPDNAEAYLNRGMVNQQLGNRVAAIADLQNALARFQKQGNGVGTQRAKIQLHKLAQATAMG